MRLYVESGLDIEFLRNALHGLAPLRIHIDRDKDQRWIEIGEPRQISFVPSEGARLTCPARVQYSLAGVPIVIEINAVTLKLCPVVLSDNGSLKLAFGLIAENVDVAGVPEFVDEFIRGRVNAALAADKTPLVWDFGELLNQTFSLPALVQPTTKLEFIPQEATVQVTSAGFRFRVGLELNVLRELELVSPPITKEPQPTVAT